MSAWINNPEVKCALRFEIPIDFQQLLNRLEASEKTIERLNEEVLKLTNAFELVNLRRASFIPDENLDYSQPNRSDHPLNGSSVQNGESLFTESIKTEIEIDNKFYLNLESEDIVTEINYDSTDTKEDCQNECYSTEINENVDPLLPAQLIAGNPNTTDNDTGLKISAVVSQSTSSKFVNVIDDNIRDHEGQENIENSSHKCLDPGVVAYGHNKLEKDSRLSLERISINELPSNLTLEQPNSNRTIPGPQINKIKTYSNTNKTRDNLISLEEPTNDNPITLHDHDVHADNKAKKVLVLQKTRNPSEFITCPETFHILNNQQATHITTFNRSFWSSSQCQHESNIPQTEANDKSLNNVCQTPKSITLQKQDDSDHNYSVVGHSVLAATDFNNSSVQSRKKFLILKLPRKNVPLQVKIYKKAFHLQKIKHSQCNFNKIYKKQC